MCAEVMLDPPAFGHVAHGRDDQQAFVGLDRAETDVDRKLPAAPVPAAQVRAGPHLARHARLRVVVAMTVVMGARRVGDQQLDRLAQQDIVRISKHLLDQPVGIDDGARGVDDHGGIRRRFQEGECLPRPAH